VGIAILEIGLWASGLIPMALSLNLPKFALYRAGLFPTGGAYFPGAVVDY